jgi:hypothetical protein
MEIVVGLFMLSTGFFMTGRLYYLNCHRRTEHSQLIRHKYRD